MQQAALMGVIESRGDGRDDRKHLAGRQNRREPLGHQPRRIAALDVVHRHPQLSLELAAGVHLHDVRVIKVGGGGRLR